MNRERRQQRITSNSGKHQLCGTYHTIAFRHNRHERSAMVSYVSVSLDTSGDDWHHQDRMKAYHPMASAGERETMMSSKFK